MPSHPSYVAPHKLVRFRALFLPFLLFWSGFQIAYGQHAVNLSTRMLVQTGDKVAIAGFIITGPADKSVRIPGVTVGPFWTP